MLFDEILRQIGSFGLYQKRLYAFLAFPCMSTGCLFLAVYVVTNTPRHRWANTTFFVCPSDSDSRWNCIQCNLYALYLNKDLSWIYNFDRALHGLASFTIAFRIASTQPEWNSFLNNNRKLRRSQTRLKISKICFRCKIPFLDNDTFEVQDAYHASLINLTIPPSDDPLLAYDKCNLFDVDVNLTSAASYVRTDDVKIAQCSEWVYDKTVFLDTFTSEVRKMFAGQV